MSSIKNLFFQPIKDFLKKRNRYLVRQPSLHGAPEHFGAIMFSRKLTHFDYFYEKIAKVDGDVFESGIWWGYGLLAHLRFIKLNGHNRKIIGFDSFQGHSEPHAKDLVGGGFANPGSVFSISEADAWKTLVMGTEKSIAQLKESITMVPGWMQETMPAFMAKNRDLKIALVHCDPDIYEPVFVTLSNVWKNLSQDGIIVIGRMNNPEYMGKTNAVNDFLNTIPASAYRLESIKIQELETNIPHDLFYITKLKIDSSRQKYN